MSFHNDVGNFGEERAATFLRQKGYSIIQQGFRYKHSELDIVAMKDGVLHFIEVKTRTGKGMAFPEKAVTASKMKHLLVAAGEFCRRHRPRERVQFDVISIIVTPGGKERIDMFNDVWL